VLSRFAASGVSVTTFCNQEGISRASLYRWRAWLGDGRSDQGEAKVPAPTFVDLGTLGSPLPAGGRLEIRLDLGGGLVLSLVRG
jgi:transposase-like protein